MDDTSFHLDWETRSQANLEEVGLAILDQEGDMP